MAKDKSKTAPAAKKPATPAGKKGVPGEDKLKLGKVGAGSQKAIDGKPLKGEPEKPVREMAEKLRDAMDAEVEATGDVKDLGEQMLSLLLKSKKTRRVVLKGRHGTYTFSTKTLTKLDKHRDKAVN